MAMLSIAHVPVGRCLSFLKNAYSDSLPVLSRRRVFLQLRRTSSFTIWIPTPPRCDFSHSVAVRSAHGPAAVGPSTCLIWLPFASVSDVKSRTAQRQDCRQGARSPRFLLGLSRFQLLHPSLGCRMLHFCSWCEIGIFSFFRMWLPRVPATSAEENVRSHCTFLAPLW